MAAADTRHQFDVEHYCALVSEERGLVEEVLTLADELRLVMIERLLAKSDLEVGLDTLLLDPSMRSTQPDPDIRDHRP